MATTKFGLPYQGSKNKLAKRIVDLLPPSEHFYDLFAGGCAITHAALLSGKFGKVYFSDTNDSVLLFRDCLEGNIPDGSEWISREEFYKRKDNDAYVRLVWSFASNQRDYIYSREIESYKKAVHEMLYAPSPNERRLKFKEVCRLMQNFYLSNTPPQLSDISNSKAKRIARDCMAFIISGKNYPPPIYGYSATCNHQRECDTYRKRATKQQMQGGSYNPTLFTRGV